MERKVQPWKMIPVSENDTRIEKVYTNNNHLSLYNNTLINHNNVTVDNAQTQICENDFLQFWAAYPRKEDRKITRDRFLKLKKKELPELLKALEIQKQSKQWKEENGKFIPLASTWLNRRRWEDEVKPMSQEEEIQTMIDEEIAKYGDENGQQIALEKYKKKHNLTTGSPEHLRLVHKYGLFS